MHKFLLTLVFSLVITDSIQAASKQEFQMGKLVSVTDDEKLNNNGGAERNAVFTVQIGDLIYTAQGARLGKHPTDLGQGLIIGDPVRVRVEKDDLILIRPNGKELKVRITRRARAQ